MDFYNDPAKVDTYEKMCETYDGTELYNVLFIHLPLYATLLELGCGPGNDIAGLKNKYTITGSDLSNEFIQRCTKRFPDISFLKLDAVSLETDITFDCVFSNKVLHHLTLDQLKKSIKQQQAVIKPGGIFGHTFWLGDKEITMEGMLFVYHNKKKLLHLISQYFTILEGYVYQEFEKDDSIFIIAQNDKQI